MCVYKYDGAGVISRILNEFGNWLAQKWYSNESSIEISLPNFKIQIKCKPIYSFKDQIPIDIS